MHHSTIISLTEATEMPRKSSIVNMSVKYVEAFFN